MLDIKNITQRMNLAAAHQKLDKLSLARAGTVEVLISCYHHIARLPVLCPVFENAIIQGLNSMENPSPDNDHAFEISLKAWQLWTAMVKPEHLVPPIVSAA